MCGRFEILTYEEVAAVVAAVEGHAAVGSLPDEPRAHARPGSSILLFGRRADDGEGLEIAESTWGFTPEWGTKPVFNTRIESALSGSGMWRGPIQDGRCVIPAAAFYEPHAAETVRSPKTGRPMKRQYRFAMPDAQPLLLAGVQADGRCSVVTCEPNRWVSPIHDRMPLALRFEEVATWLSPDWPALANRTDLSLEVTPEQPSNASEPDQLTLF
ncbi:MAG: SOS response-associated peptidase family protein [Eggerthellaceae bacterium]|nr:SOS response-associated peptidase family protein [Eggerthellaceae bacterium]